MKAFIRKFIRDERGITAVEYGILAAIVAAAIVAIFQPSIQAFFTAVFAKLTAVLDSL